MKPDPKAQVRIPLSEGKSIIGEIVTIRSYDPTCPRPDAHETLRLLEEKYGIRRVEPSDQEGGDGSQGDR